MNKQVLPKRRELLAVRGCRTVLHRTGPLKSALPHETPHHLRLSSALLLPDQDTNALTYIGLAVILGAYNGVANAGAVPGAALAWSKYKARSLLCRGRVQHCRSHWSRPIC